MPRIARKVWSHPVDLRAWSHLLPYLDDEDACLTLDNTKLLSVDVWRDISKLPEPQATAMLPFLVEYIRCSDFKDVYENLKNFMFCLLERLASLPQRHPACENFLVSSLPSKPYNKSNRMRLLMALKFDCLDQLKSHFGSGLGTSKWEFAPRLTARLTNQKGYIELDPGQPWKSEKRVVTDLQMMGDAFHVLKLLLKHHDQVGASGGGSGGGGSASFWNREDHDEADMGTGFTNDPLIDKGIPRQFLKPSPLDWSIPLFAEFYLNELDSLPDSTSLTWLCKVLLKRLKTHFSPHLLAMSMALAGHCSGADLVRGELDTLALSDPAYLAIPLADLERMSKKSEKDDSNSMLSENDDNGNNLVETPAVDRQLLERVAHHLDQCDHQTSQERCDSPVTACAKCEAGGDERAWTLLRTCMSGLVIDKEKEGTSWAQEAFDMPRLWCWNARHFDRPHTSLLAVKPDSDVREDFVFFFSQVWTRMFPKEQPDIPYFEEVRAAYIQTVSRLSKLYFKEVPAPAVKEAPPRTSEEQTNSSSDKESSSLDDVVPKKKPAAKRPAKKEKRIRRSHCHDLPFVDPMVYKLVEVVKDIGLVEEMPKNLAFHVILKLVHQQKLYNVHKRIKCPQVNVREVKEAFEVTQLTGGEILTASQVTELMRDSDYALGHYECVPHKLVEQVLAQVKTQVAEAVENLFYAPDYESVKTGLSRHFGMAFTGDIKPCKKAMARVLVNKESLRWRQHKGGLGAKANSWMLDQLIGLRESWNLKPFERALQNLRGKSQKLSEKHDIPADVLDRCFETLSDNSRTSLVLVGVIERTVQDIKSDQLCQEYSGGLEKIVRKRFQKLLMIG